MQSQINEKVSKPIPDLLVTDASANVPDQPFGSWPSKVAHAGSAYPSPRQMNKGQQRHHCNQEFPTRWQLAILANQTRRVSEFNHQPQRLHEQPTRQEPNANPGGGAYARQQAKKLSSTRNASGTIQEIPETNKLQHRNRRQDRQSHDEANQPHTPLNETDNRHLAVRISATPIRPRQPRHRRDRKP
jgi:hypothetical protein